MTPIAVAGILVGVCVGFTGLVQAFEWFADRLPINESHKPGAIQLDEWAYGAAGVSAGLAILSAAAIVGVCVFAVVLGMFTPFI
jgi:hypothetical protein